MALFFGTHQNKLDAKGRVSIPATFRSVLKKMSHSGEGAAVATMYLRPSHLEPCIEGWTEQAFEALNQPAEEEFGLMSPEHAEYMIALFGEACLLETDKEGRITLPPSLMEYASISDTVMFIGARNIFEIWEPAAGTRRLAAAKAKAKAAGYSFKPIRPVGPAPGGTA